MSAIWGIVVRRVIQRRSIRIGDPDALKIVYFFLILWGLAAVITVAGQWPSRLRHCPHNAILALSVYRESDDFSRGTRVERQGGLGQAIDLVYRFSLPFHVQEN